MRPYALLVAGLLLLLPGCALEKAIDVAGDVARTTALTVVEKSPPLSSLAVGAQADITNPTYRVLAATVNGFLLEVGIQGLDIDSSLGGQGTGDGTQLSDEARAAIREQLGDDVADKVIGIIEGWLTASACEEDSSTE